MPQPTLATVGVIGVLVPWGNTTTQLEIEPHTPPGVINAVARFDFGPDVDLPAELEAIAAKITDSEPRAVLLALSPEMTPGGMDRARRYEQVITQASGLPAFSSTFGTIHELAQRGITRVGLIAPAPQERVPVIIENFASQGIDVITAHGMNCGLSDIKATSLDDIADAFRTVDHPDVEAFVQVGTGLPAFAIAPTTEAELGRPVITSSAAGYRQTLQALGIGGIANP